MLAKPVRIHCIKSMQEFGLVYKIVKIALNREVKEFQRRSMVSLHHLVRYYKKSVLRT
jgi:hypothetical protein